GQRGGRPPGSTGRNKGPPQNGRRTREGTRGEHSAGEGARAPARRAGSRMREGGGGSAHTAAVGRRGRLRHYLHGDRSEKTGGEARGGKTTRAGRGKHPRTQGGHHPQSE
ncbi:Hypothetical predicted protein, partial [Pelobates cultripes]